MTAVLRSYRLRDEQETLVLVAPGARHRAGEIVAERLAPSSIALVEDQGVPGEWRLEVREGLRAAGAPLHIYQAPGGEGFKTLESLVSLWRWMLEKGLTRDSLLVALGGGAVSDTAGFAAATYMRGMPWAVVPTTLLAMADAALGGKTAVNLEAKNMVGAFHHPSLVVADTELAATLPEREYRSGLAEIVKHAVIRGYSMLEELERLAPELLERSPEAVAEAVALSVDVKMEIVSRDPRETRGERMLLNLGHTYGHALEKAAGYRVPHGYAVSIGLNVEMRAAEMLLGFPGEERLRVKRLLERLGLPTRPPGEPGCEAVVEHVRLDKKRRGDRLLLPLPRRIGRVELVSLGLMEARQLLLEACRDLVAEPPVEGAA